MRALHRARRPRGVSSHASRDAGEFSALVPRWRWTARSRRCRATGADARGFAWHAVRQIFTVTPRRFYASGHRARLRIERIIVPPSRPDEYYIGNVAIAPDPRRGFLGMIRALHEEACARRVGKGTSGENPRA